MTNTAMIRPAWTPATIALMVLGFFLFWPLGLAMLAYILWGNRLEGFKRGVNEKTDSLFGSMRNCCKSESFNLGTTGNAAFDDWRREKLERSWRKSAASLRKHAPNLKPMRPSFSPRSRQGGVFDRFMAERHSNAKRHLPHAARPAAKAMPRLPINGKTA
ncbi:DUF2852 domain-containing protein [Brucella abortus]|nr:DUF2852 domain-containing protein [Brucella abortus]